MVQKKELDQKEKKSVKKAEIVSEMPTKKTSKKPEKKVSAFHELQETFQASLPVLQEQYKKYSNQFFILFFSAIFGFLLAGISYYELTKSSYLSFIPKNTNSFLHVQLQSVPAVLFQKSEIIIPRTLQLQDFQELRNLDISYLSLFHSEKNDSFLLEGVSKSDLKKFFKNAETTKLVQKTGDFYLLPSGNGVFCELRFRKTFCSTTSAGLQAFLNKDVQAKKPFKTEFFKLPKFAPVTFFIDTKKASIPLLQVHKEMLSSLYGTLEMTETNKVLIRSNVSLNRVLKRSAVKVSKTYFSDLFSQDDTLFFFSGKNFAGQWKETEEYYKTISPEYALILKGVLQQKVKEIFGTSVQWYQDILPLFQNAYAFAVVENEGTQFAFVAENVQLSSVQFLLDAFFTNRGRFTVEKKTLQIDDDTVLSMVESNDEKVKKYEETFEDTKIIGYEIPEKKSGIFVAEKGKNVYVSSSKIVLKSMINGSGTLTKTLPSSLKNAYEHGYIAVDQIQKITSLLPFTFPALSVDFLKNIAWESQMSPGILSVATTLEFATEPPLAP